MNLSITSTDVNNNFINMLEQVKKPEIARELEILKQKQNENELDLISKTNVYNIAMSNNNLSKDKRNNSKSQNNTHMIENSVYCSDSIIYVSPHSTSSSYFNKIIRTYTNNLKSNSVENVSDSLKIIVSNNIHQLIVGIYGTNKLRKYIPNFIYVYGGFKCCSFESNENTNDSINYLIIENTEPSISFSKYIETCTGMEFVSVYIQILYALRFAYKTIDFTHYNLDSKNVLLRIPNNSNNDIKFQIEYETENGNEYISSFCIPTLVNFETSHIITDDLTDELDKIIKHKNHYGTNGLIQYSVYSYKSWIFHDLYKLLMTSMMDAYKFNNQSVIRETNKLFYYFNQDESPSHAINEQWKLFFSFPLNNKTIHMNIDNFSEYIRKVCDTSSYINSIQINSILNPVTLNVMESPVIPNNIIDFYDMKSDTKLFNYVTAIESHISNLNNVYIELTNLIRGLKLLNLSTMTPTQIFTENTLNITRSMYITLSSIIDKIVIVNLYYKTGLYAAKLYNDQNNINNLNILMDKYNTNVSPIILQSKELMKSNYRILEKYKDNEQLNNDLGMKWYFDGIPLFLKSLNNIQ